MRRNTRSKRKLRLCPLNLKLDLSTKEAYHFCHTLHGGYSIELRPVSSIEEFHRINFARFDGLSRKEQDFLNDYGTQDEFDAYTKQQDELRRGLPLSLPK